MEEPHVIYGVHVTNRTIQVPNVQKLLTEYGCNIKTRIELHHVDEKMCIVDPRNWTTTLSRIPGRIGPVFGRKAQ
jgi:hypothetical protein